MLPTRQLCGTTSTLAYLVLLRVEIARFTPSGLPCGTPLGLVSVALLLTSRWAAVSCYAVLCSPDGPPVPGFPDCTSGGLARFTALIIPEHGVHCAEGIENRCSTSHQRAMTEPTHFDTGAREWDQRPTSLQLAAVPPRLLAQVPFAATDRVLDFGAGTGLLATAIAPHVAQVTALDSSGPMLQVLREKALPTSPRCSRTSSTACPSATTPS